MHIPAARDNDRVGYFVISTFKVVNLFSSNGAWLKNVEECLAVDKHAVYAQSLLCNNTHTVSQPCTFTRFYPYGKDQTSKILYVV